MSSPQRAAIAWQYATAGMAQHGKEYKGLAKGAPALIMNSGLMPTLAFYSGKGKPAPGGKSGADAGQADSASDESGRGNEARIDAVHPPVEPAAGRRSNHRQ